MNADREKSLVAIVTGAGGGIGRATAKLFGGAGYSVVVADIDAASAADTVTEIGAEGGSAVRSVTDVSDPDQVGRMVRLAVETFGSLDAAVNNAAVPQALAFDGPDSTMVHEMSYEEWDRVISINLSGAFYCVRHEVRAMRESGTGGSIVNVSSAGAVRALEGMAAYTASKKGLFGLSEAAAVENGRYGIRVNTVIPGNVTGTRMSFLASDGTVADVGSAKTFGEVSPLERGAAPTEIAEAIVWLCSDASSYVTGTSILVDGGTTVRHPASKREL